MKDYTRRVGDFEATEATEARRIFLKNEQFFAEDELHIGWDNCYVCSDAPAHELSTNDVGKTVSSGSSITCKVQSPGSISSLGQVSSKSFGRNGGRIINPYLPGRKSC